MLAELFGIERRATIENPRVSLQDPKAWDELFGSREAESGVKVSAETALSFPPVWQAVSLISGDIAKMPLYPYRKQNDGTRDVDRTHPAYYVAARMANAEHTAFQFWRDFMVSALIWNRAYAWIERNGRGEPMGLYFLLPDRTTIERKRGEITYLTEVSDDNNSKLVRMPSADVLHLRGISLNGIDGHELLTAARNSWGLGLAAQGFASKFFRHGVRSSGILELPAPLSEKAKDNIVEGFRKHHEGQENWFKTVILRDGAKFHQTSIPPEEGQMNETREQQVRDTARLFNLAPSRLGLADSVSYNSKTEDNQSYLDSTLSPWMAGLCAECWAKLLSTTQQSSDSHFFAHDTSALLQMNRLLRFQGHAIGIRNGWLNANEVRRAENMPPRKDGQGDDFVDVKAANGAGGMKSGGVGDSGQNQSTGDPPADNSGSQPRSAEAMRVVFNVASRARHKAKNSRAFVEWIDGDLKSHRDEARSLLDGDDAIVSQMQQELKRIALVAKEHDLYELVDAEMALFEHGVK